MKHSPEWQACLDSIPDATGIVVNAASIIAADRTIEGLHGLDYKLGKQAPESCPACGAAW